MKKETPACRKSALRGRLAVMASISSFLYRSKATFFQVSLTNRGQGAKLAARGRTRGVIEERTVSPEFSVASQIF